MYPADDERIIKPQEMALGVDEENNLRLVIPDQEISDLSHPPAMQLMTAAYVRARDPVWVEEMLEWMTTT